ncbi:hypothetical protein N7499_007667 [Penicillium canescens]|nr:hypothetical protein N7499_007667 [Penicillium canescens]
MCVKGAIWSTSTQTSTDTPQCDTVTSSICHGKCVSTTAQPICKEGTRQGDTCVGEVPKCDNGSFENGHCVTETIPRCDDDQEFRDGQCVTTKKPQCDGTWVYDESVQACVDANGPQCPPGQHSYNGKCILTIKSSILWEVPAILWLYCTCLDGGHDCVFWVRKLHTLDYFHLFP